MHLTAPGVLDRFDYVLPSMRPLWVIVYLVALSLFVGACGASSEDSDADVAVTDTAEATEAASAAASGTVANQPDASTTTEERVPELTASTTQPDSQPEDTGADGTINVSAVAAGLDARSEGLTTSCELASADSLVPVLALLASNATIDQADLLVLDDDTLKGRILRCSYAEPYVEGQSGDVYLSVSVLENVESRLDSDIADEQAAVVQDDPHAGGRLVVLSYEPTDDDARRGCLTEWLRDGVLVAVRVERIQDNCNATVSAVTQVLPQLVGIAAGAAGATETEPSGANGASGNTACDRLDSAADSLWASNLDDLKVTKARNDSAECNLTWESAAGPDVFATYIRPDDSDVAQLAPQCQQVSEMVGKAVIVGYCPSGSGGFTTADFVLFTYDGVQYDLGTYSSSEAVPPPTLREMKAALELLVGDSPASVMP